jgi:acetylglutamate synthase
MKKIIALAALLVAASVFAAEEKQVCVDKVTKDGKPVITKDGKPQQECKTIKVHKKLEVEDKK